MNGQNEAATLFNGRGKSVFQTWARRCRHLPRKVVDVRFECNHWHHSCPFVPTVVGETADGQADGIHVSSEEHTECVHEITIPYVLLLTLQSRRSYLRDKWEGLDKTVNEFES